MRICFTLVGKKHHLAICFSRNWPRENDCKVNRSCGFDRDIGHEKMVMFPCLLNSWAMLSSKLFGGDSCIYERAWNAAGWRGLGGGMVVLSAVYFTLQNPPCEAAWSHEEDSTSFAAFASVTWRSRVLEGEQFSNKSSELFELEGIWLLSMKEGTFYMAHFDGLTENKQLGVTRWLFFFQVSSSHWKSH